MLALLSGWRHHRHYPWHTGLTLFGLALAVAMTTAVMLTNASARAAFAADTHALFGNASHQLMSTNGGVAVDWYRRLRVDWGIRHSAPVIEAPALWQDAAFTLLGLAPLAESDLRGRQPFWRSRL